MAMTDLYTSANGTTATVQKLYGSIEGESILLYDRNSGGGGEGGGGEGGEQDWGTVYYYESEDDRVAQNRKSVKLTKAKDYLKLVGTLDAMSGSINGWSATIGEEKITVYSGSGGYGASGTSPIYDWPVICGYEFGPDVDFIPNLFLAGTLAMDMALTIPEAVTEIGGGLLMTSNYNSPLTLPDTIEELHPLPRSEMGSDWGFAFLRGCWAFNSEIKMSGKVAAMLYATDNFLYNCQAFNQLLPFPDEVKTIGKYFLHANKAFNQPIDISKVEQLGNYFLYNCTAFNQPLDFSSLKDLKAEGVLTYCTSFNQPVVIPEGVETIGYNFMSRCTSFNQPITLPQGLKSIAGGLLANCSSFNQQIVIPNTVTTLGTNVLTECTSFNRPITVPSSVTSVGGYFLQYCNSMISQVTINCPATAFSTSDYTLSTNSTSAIAYTSGIPIGGTDAAAFRSRFPNRTSNPYRKLK